MKEDLKVKYTGEYLYHEKIVALINCSQVWICRILAEEDKITTISCIKNPDFSSFNNLLSSLCWGEAFLDLDNYEDNKK